MSGGGSFFGLIVKPNKRYDTTVKETFRLSKACLEPVNNATGGNKVTSLYAEYDGEEYILANLGGPQHHLNESLDLAFSLGEKVSFKVEGPGTVHLSGNILEEDEGPDFLDSMMEGESSEEEEAVGTKGEEKKRKKTGNEVASPPAKKLKQPAQANGTKESSSSEEDDDDSSDDDDDDEQPDTTLGDLDSTVNFAEEEDSDDDDDDDDDDDEDDDEDDDDDDSDDEEDEEVPSSPAKKVTNGTPAKKGDKDNLAKSAKKEPKTPEVKAKKPEEKTGATPKGPKGEPKTPKAESKTPKAESKTPKADSKTPKGEQPKTPKADTKKPATNGATPKSAAKPGGGDTPAKKTLKGGLSYEDLKQGNGPECTVGKKVGVYYAGRLKSNNKQFDACQQGKPFKIRLGAGEVIKGWDVGLVGMKVGGKRRLTIPPALAYGAKGAPPDIPPNSTLVFDVECKFVN